MERTFSDDAADCEEVGGDFAAGFQRQDTNIMETTMGRVLTAATVEHLGDLWDLERGRITVDAVRRLEITNAS